VNQCVFDFLQYKVNEVFFTLLMCYWYRYRLVYIYGVYLLRIWVSSVHVPWLLLCGLNFVKYEIRCDVTLT
jgi:hypothetical protein